MKCNVRNCRKKLPRSATTAYCRDCLRKIREFAAGMREGEVNESILSLIKDGVK